MICKLTYICLLSLLLNCGFQKNFIYNGAKTVVSNPHVQRYGGMFAYGMFAYRNAEENTLWWLEDPHGLDKNTLHYRKNSALFWFATSAFLTGLEVGQKHSTLREVLERKGYESELVWTVWQLRKHHIVSGKAFDFRKEYNEHLFVLPGPDKDRYLGLKGWQVPAVYVGFTGTGIWGLIK